MFSRSFSSIVMCISIKWETAKEACTSGTDFFPRPSLFWYEKRPTTPEIQEMFRKIDAV
jgi:hypothetical protein